MGYKEIAELVIYFTFMIVLFECICPKKAKIEDLLLYISITTFISWLFYPVICSIILN